MDLWKYSKKGYLSKSVSITSIPDGCMAKWSDNFEIASPPIQRELLCISEALRFLNVEGVGDQNEAVPTYFYNMTEQELLARGDMLVKLAYQHGHQVDRSLIVEPADKVQWVAWTVEQEVQEVIPENIQERWPHCPVVQCEVYANSNLAKRTVDVQETIR